MGQSTTYFTTDTGLIGSPFPGILLWLVVIAAVVGLWVALSRPHATGSEAMERSDRVPQLYGYFVCLIAVVVILATLSSTVEKVFALRDPLTSASSFFPWGGMPALTSFEAYRATQDRATMMQGPPGERVATAEKLTEPELRARYDALRADQIARTRLEAQRDLTKNILLLVLSAALFWWHWRWVRGPDLRPRSTPPIDPVRSVSS